MQTATLRLGTGVSSPLRFPGIDGGSARLPRLCHRRRSPENGPQRSGSRGLIEVTPSARLVGQLSWSTRFFRRRLSAILRSGPSGGNPREALVDVGGALLICCAVLSLFQQKKLGQFFPSRTLYHSVVMKFSERPHTKKQPLVLEQIQSTGKVPLCSPILGFHSIFGIVCLTNTTNITCFLSTLNPSAYLLLWLSFYVKRIWTLTILQRRRH